MYLNWCQKWLFFIVQCGVIGLYFVRTNFHENFPKLCATNLGHFEKCNFYLKIPEATIEKKLDTFYSNKLVTLTETDLAPLYFISHKSGILSG